MGISTVAWHCFGSLRAPFEEYQRVTNFISEKQNADGVYGNEKTAKAVLVSVGRLALKPAFFRRTRAAASPPGAAGVADFVPVPVRFVPEVLCPVPPDRA